MALEWSGVSRESIAKEIGVDPKTVSRWTHDKGPVARGHLIAISLRTGVPLEWIEHGTGPSGDGDGDDGLPRLDSNQQPSGLRPRLRNLPALLPLLAA